MTWLLSWRKVSAVILNVTLQLLVIYRLEVNLFIESKEWYS